MYLSACRSSTVPRIDSEQFALATATVSNTQLNIGVMSIDGVHSSSKRHYLMSQAINPALL